VIYIAHTLPPTNGKGRYTTQDLYKGDMYLRLIRSELLPLFGARVRSVLRPCCGSQEKNVDPAGVSFFGITHRTASLQPVLPIVKIEDVSWNSELSEISIRTQMDLAVGFWYVGRSTGDSSLTDR